MSTKNKNVEILEGNIAKIEINIDKNEAKKAYDATLKQMAQRINIPGFRQGKVPLQMVETRLGKSAVREEALKAIFPKYFAKIVEENKLNLVQQPYIEKYDFEDDKDITMTVKAELKPEVELPVYKNVEIQYEEFKNAANAADKEIEGLKERYANLKSVTGRKVKATDTVVFDFEGSKDGVPFDGGAAKGYSLDLAHSNFIPGFAEGLVGHEIGEEFDINVKFPENYHSEDLKGADAVFKIKIHEIKERELAELNDDLALRASGGKFKTIDELKADILKYLEAREKRENEQRKEAAAFEKFVDEAKIDIQPTMVAREKEAVYEENKNMAAQHGAKWEDVIEREGKEKIEKEFENQAIKRIRNLLVIEKIAMVENVKVDKGELLEQINRIASQYGENKEKAIGEIIKNQHSLAIISQQIITQKVAKLFVDNNTFVPAKTKGNK